VGNSLAFNSTARVEILMTANEHPATKAHGEALMQAFIPRMGLHYTNGRNYDHGAGGHRDVSCLSPYLRRRLVMESNAVAAAVAAHGTAVADKFVQEIFWRAYFKGWLERRPSIWASYLDGLKHDLLALDSNQRLRRAVEDAETGNTGLACFDAWTTELIETGYLHNHARMWFASIWIFTLGLPWRVGADFFYRHLLDGDPASNTLGWRWVAGLHTRGKPYAARASNIAKFTGQRFTPREVDLAASVMGLADSEPEGLPPVQPLRVIHAPVRGMPAALLITEDDCQIEDFDLASFDVRATATMAASHLRSSRPVAEAVVQFEAQALADAAARLAARMNSLPATTTIRAGLPADLAAWAAQCGAQQIVTPYVPEGPLRDWLRRAEPALAARGIRVCEWRRGWDSAIWPYADAGFFKIKERIPNMLQQLGTA
jgi:deoxyribodipyrimidine photo-lyase